VRQAGGDARDRALDARMNAERERGAVVGNLTAQGLEFGCAILAA